MCETTEGILRWKNAIRKENEEEKRNGKNEEVVVGQGVVLINLHPEGLYPHFEAAVVGVYEKHRVHHLDGRYGKVKFLGFGQIAPARINDESKHQGACNRVKYAGYSHLLLHAYGCSCYHTATADGVGLSLGEVIHEGLGCLGIVTGHCRD